VSDRSRIHPTVGRIWVDRFGRQVVSPRGRAFIMREEGMRPYAYEGPGGHPGNRDITFGVGHFLHWGRITAFDRLRYGTKDNPKLAKALRVYKRDLGKYAKPVRAAAGRKLPQHQFDALVSLCINIGQSGFAGSTVARLVAQGARQGVGKAIRMWDQPAILEPRRDREVDLYQNGNYTP
jgi:lysozyme